MSAWLVTREHIAAMVAVKSFSRSPRQVEVKWRVDPQGRAMSVASGDEDRVGQMLWDANAISLAHRYGVGHHDMLTEQYKRGFHFTWPRVMPTTVEALKLADCYVYQSCEDQEFWADSEAKRFVDAYRLQLVRNLDGYDAAPWGWDLTHETAEKMGWFGL